MTDLVKPMQDGKFIVVLRDDTSLRAPQHDMSIDGPAALITNLATASIREYPFSCSKWNMHSWGLEITRLKEHPDGSGKDIFPFANVLSCTAIPNSNEYDELLLSYLRLCDHEWLTYPGIMPPLTYCSICRLDMNDLAEVMDPATVEPPAVVVDSPDFDRVSHGFDGRDPFEEAASVSPAIQVIDVSELPTEVLDEVDRQIEALGEQSSPGAIDDPDGTDF